MNRRYVQIMLGLALLFIGLNGLGDLSAFSIFAGLGGFYLLARQFEESRHNQERDNEYERHQRSNQGRESYNFEGIDDRVNRKPATNADRVYGHALEAVQAAGLDASNTPVLPVDLGLFVHKGDERPKLYRTRRLPKDADYVQPFVQLRVPTRARGNIAFDILDDYGEVIFTRTEAHDLKRGRNLVVPTRRIPVHDALDMDIGTWTLRISADGTPIAVHNFGWQEPRDHHVSESLEADGEMTAELQAAMAESRLEEMSLDELLSFQDDKPSAASQRRA